MVAATLPAPSPQEQRPTADFELLRRSQYIKVNVSTES
jgi:hypothetical protein